MSGRGGSSEDVSCGTSAGNDAGGAAVRLSVAGIERMLECIGTAEKRGSAGHETYRTGYAENIHESVGTCEGRAAGSHCQGVLRGPAGRRAKRRF